MPKPLDETTVIDYEVTPEDINAGGRADAWNCPYALALSRATGAWKVDTCWTRAVLVFRDGLILDGALSRRAVRFIDRLDRGQPIEPGRFRLMKCRRRTYRYRFPVAPGAITDCGAREGE